MTGRVTAQTDAPKPDDDIRRLRLDVSARRNAGAFGDVAAIQRINTLGGVLSGACPEVGRLSEVPYTSDYVLLRRP